MTARQYNRLCRLVLTKPTGYFTVGGIATGGNQVTISALRVTFSIEKDLASTPNNCEVSIFNLNGDDRAQFQKSPLQVRLEVGYDTDDDLQRLFTGDLRNGLSRLEGTEWQTKLQLGDGDRAYRHARTNKSYAAGTQVNQIIKDMARGMGLDLPANGPQVNGQVTGGAAVHGPTRRGLDTMLRPRGMHWSIQDGRLQLLKDGAGQGSTRPEEAIVVDQDSGLIGSPDFGPPEKESKSPTLTFRSTLNPRLVPGGKVALTSRAITGQFKVIKVKHVGDTRGDDWYSECEAKLK